MADPADEDFYRKHAGATRRGLLAEPALVSAALGQRLRGPVGGGFALCDRLSGVRRGPAPPHLATPPVAVARNFTVKIG